MKNKLISGLLFIVLLFVIAQITTFKKLQQNDVTIHNLHLENSRRQQEINLLKKGVFLLSEERDKLTSDKKDLLEKNNKLNSNLVAEKKKLKEIEKKYHELTADTLQEIIIFAYRHDTKDTITTTEDIILPKPVSIWVLQKNDSLQIYKNLEESFVKIIDNQKEIISNDSLIIQNLEETIAIKDQVIEKQEEILENKDAEISLHEDSRKKENRKHNVQKLGLVGIIAGLLLLL